MNIYESILKAQLPGYYQRWKLFQNGLFAAIEVHNDDDVRIVLMRVMIGENGHIRIKGQPLFETIKEWSYLCLADAQADFEKWDHQDSQNFLDRYVKVHNFADDLRISGTTSWIMIEEKRNHEN